MNRLTLAPLVAGLLVAGCTTSPSAPPEEPRGPQPTETAESPGPNASPAEPSAGDGEASGSAASLEVVPLRHGSFLLAWNDVVVAVDPVTGALEASEGDEPMADLILLTDIHGDHLDPSAVATLRKQGAPVVAPQAVVDEAGDALPDPTVMANGDTETFLEGEVRIEAVPMYNIKRTRPDSGEPFHVKGRGNGYVLTLGGSERVYVSGDTECTPEMKALEDIDVALVTMNLPYTMPVEEAAECIRAFRPEVVYPFHFRGQDPSKLDDLLADVPGVEVRVLTWYPQGE